MQARQQTRKPTEHIGGGLFSALYGWVSHESMKKVEEQRKLLDRPKPLVSSTCTGAFTRSYGLPCAHKIKSLQDGNRCLRLDDFHQQWYLRRNGTRPQPILEPSRVESRVQMSATIAQGSTQRAPSAFEQFERTPPTCSRCHTVGHSRASKACTLRQQEIILESSVPELAGPIAAESMLAGWSQEAQDALVAQTDDEAKGHTSTQDTIIVCSPAPAPSPSPSLSPPQPALRLPPLPAGADLPIPEVTPPHAVAPQVSRPLPYYAPEAIYHRYVMAKRGLVQSPASRKPEDDPSLSQGCWPSAEIS